jgi:hypothetical protein
MVLVIAMVGTAMDMTPTILILTPVLMPVVKAAGIDPVYFGVLFIINNAIGLITPPVGTVLNVVAGVGKMKHGRSHPGRGAVHDRAVRRDVPDGAVPAARDGAGCAGSIDSLKPAAGVLGYAAPGSPPSTACIRPSLFPSGDNP